MLNKKNNYLKNKTSLLVSLFFVSALFLFGTLAIKTDSRYKSNTTISNSPNIAPWKIKVNGTDITRESTITENNIIWNTNDKVKSGKVAPGSVGTYRVIIDPTGSKVAVDWKIEINTNSSPLKVIGVKVDNEDILVDSENIYEGIISLSDVKLNKTRTIEITFKWLEENSDTSHGINHDTFSIPIKVNTKQGFRHNTLADKILLNTGNYASVSEAKNAIKAKPSPNFNTVATTDEGMFMMEDDDGESYYFRGTAPNNWVKFGKTGTTPNEGDDIYWRIVRINGDGSIRLIFSGIGSPQTKGDATGIGKSSFNKLYKHIKYSGYSYGENDINCTPPNCIDSTIKTYVENWFQNNLTDEENKLQDNPFCIDKSVGERPASWSTSYNPVYGAASRTMREASQGPKNPQLKCPRAQDKYLKANGYLKYPIGLLTLDEASLAGGIGVPYISNNKYYLYTDSSFWLDSPGYWDSSYSLADVSGLGSGGYLYATWAVYTLLVGRPVSSLKSDILYVSGDGSRSNPYIVK